MEEVDKHEDYGYIPSGHPSWIVHLIAALAFAFFMVQLYNIGVLPVTWLEILKLGGYIGAVSHYWYEKKRLERYLAETQQKNKSVDNP